MVNENERPEIDGNDGNAVLALLLRMSSITTVTNLPVIAQNRVKALVRSLMYYTALAEQRSEAGEVASLAHGSRLALLTALRVMLHPDNRERLIAESQRSAREGRRELG